MSLGNGRFKQLDFIQNYHSEKQGSPFTDVVLVNEDKPVKIFGIHWKRCNGTDGTVVGCRLQSLAQPSNVTIFCSGVSSNDTISHFMNPSIISPRGLKLNFIGDGNTSADIGLSALNIQYAS